MSSFVDFASDDRLRMADRRYRAQRMNKLNLSEEENDRNTQAYRKLVRDARIYGYFHLLSSLLQVLLMFALAWLSPIDTDMCFFLNPCGHLERLRWFNFTMQLGFGSYSAILCGVLTSRAYVAERNHQSFQKSLRRAEDNLVARVEAQIRRENRRRAELVAQEALVDQPDELQGILRWRDYEPGMFTIHGLKEPHVVGSYYVLVPQGFDDRPPELCRARDQDDLTCPICMEDYTDDAAITRLPCQHTFHTACTRRSLQLAELCPMCRVPVPLTGPRPLRDEQTVRITGRER